VQVRTATASPTVGAALTYVVTVRNLGAPASRAYLRVQLPAQVAYAASETDRGPGCTGTTTLDCDLDFLSGDLVATVRIVAVIREPGTLTLTAISSAQPGDVQPANDTATAITLVAVPEPARPPTSTAGVFRLARTTLPVVARRGTTAELSVRFSVSTAARLEARVTPLRSTRVLALLPGTTLAGRRSTALRATATATVSRQGRYVLRARVRSAQLVRGRAYLVRLLAVDSAGRRRSIAIRVVA
jgi:hypothetical protein